MYKFILHAEAEIDFFDSVDWYGRRSVEAAVDFIDEVEKSIQKICENPFSYHKEIGDFHQYLLPNFPFKIVYKIKDDFIFSAIYHHKRNPKKKFRKL